MTEVLFTAAAEADRRQVKAFRAGRSEAGGTEPRWLIDSRESGIQSFARTGWPTTAHEDWRFTNLAGLARLPFLPQAASTAPQADLDSLRPWIAALPLANLPAMNLVFVDGHYQAALSDWRDLPQGVGVDPLRQLVARNPAWLEAHFHASNGAGQDPIAALNSAFADDGVAIRIPEGVRVGFPIRLLFVARCRAAGAATFPRIVLDAGARSHVTVIEQYASLGSSPGATHPLTTIQAGAEAELEHLRFQDESLATWHLASIDARFERASRVALHSFALGGCVSRVNIRTKLDGEHLEAVLNGLYLTRGTQLADHHMVVEHAQPACASHEYFNGILDGRSKAVFHGRILVRPCAQKTDAKQTNKNLLLSDDAVVNTKPQLEIYADDVKCTHGATIGQMNEESIFYLRSRGISLASARRILMHAFAGEIVDRIQHPALRDELDRLVWNRLEMARPELAVSD